MNINSVAGYLSQKEFRHEIKLTQQSGVNYFDVPKVVVHTRAARNNFREIK
jgi:hypothetical protein